MNGSEDGFRVVWIGRLGPRVPDTFQNYSETCFDAILLMWLHFTDTQGAARLRKRAAPC